MTVFPFKNGKAFQSAVPRFGTAWGMRDYYTILYNLKFLFVGRKNPHAVYGIPFEGTFFYKGKTHEFLRPNNNHDDDNYDNTNYNNNNDNTVEPPNKVNWYKGCPFIKTKISSPKFF